MTQCKSESSLRFAPGPARRQVVADFEGGRLTTNGGLLALREVDRRLGLTQQLAAVIHDDRDPVWVHHEVKTMLAQRVYALAAGYEDGNDHQHLRHDPALQIAAEVEPHAQWPLASPSTLSRFENAANHDDCFAMSKVVVEQFITNLEAQGGPTEPLILDFDATDDRIHGTQEGRYFHGHYDSYCYLPLYVFCGHELLAAYLRSSSRGEARNTRAILMLLVRRLRQQWPDVEIIFRGDSGFCGAKTINWCLKNRVDYVLGLKPNKVLKPMIEPLLEKVKAAFKPGGEKVRRFEEHRYGAKTWLKSQRVIARAVCGELGPDGRFIVTSLSKQDGDAQKIYDEVYCARGEMENRIKEQQLGLFADRTSCSKMRANQFRLLLSSAAYVLLQALRREGLADTDLSQAQVGTIRLKLIKIAARVVVSARRVVLHLSSSYPYRDAFRQLVERLASPAASSG